MTDTGADHVAAPPPELHLISHIRWEREGSETFETRRAHLLDALATLADQMNADSRLHLLLGGQTVLLEDIAAVRPDLLTLLVIYNAGGRLGIGPWYVLVDEALVNGEALIRNLLMGRVDVVRYGLNSLPAGYLPEGTGHTGQLPQILRGFGLDAVFLRHGAPVAHMPFRWEGPDGSTVLVLDHDSPVQQQDDLSAIVATVKAQQAPRLWMADAASTPENLLAQLQARFEFPVIRSSLPEYIKALRAQSPDEERPNVQGELRLQGLRENSYLLPGLLSARMYVKQRNYRLQNQLIYAAEPWTALALTHGQVRHPENLSALLQFSWRLLLQNQARATLGGAGSDPVHESAEIRARQCEDISTQVIHNALQALSDNPSRDMGSAFSSTRETHVVAWNPHNWPIEQVVEIPLRLPVGYSPAVIIDPDGDELVCGWQVHEPLEAAEYTMGVLSFIASVPPVGYAAYRVQLFDQPEYNAPQRTAGRRITGVPDQVTLAIEDGRLTTQITEPPVVDGTGQVVRPGITQTLIQDLLRFYDGGDAGDVFNYSPPNPDVLVEADLAPDVQVEAAALYQRLIMRHRLRVAPALKADRSRMRGVKLIELTTTATLYDYMPGVYFHTTFANSVSDHRLRAHLRTGIASDLVLADSAFDIVARRVTLAEQPPLDPNREAATKTYPMQTLCAVQDASAGMALAARGLPEFEPLVEDGQVTLALTLVRSVGWLSRADLQTRTAAVGPLLAVPDAQCQREISAEYALLPFWANDPSLLRRGREYSAPLQVYQYDRPPADAQRSYLSIEGEHVILTALKPPQTGQGWIVRLLNPTHQTIEVRLKPEGRLVSAALVNLAEQQPQRLSIDDGSVNLALAPHKVVTLRLEFERS